MLDLVTRRSYRRLLARTHRLSEALANATRERDEALDRARVAEAAARAALRDADQLRRLALDLDDDRASLRDALERAEREAVRR